MRQPTPDDYAEARRLLAPALEWPVADGFTPAKYLHDHDEVLGRFWFKDPPRPRDEAYWDETADLLLDYFELLAGADSERLVEGFLAWMKCSPGASKCYEEGDDMARAGLVDWYLKVVR